MRKAYYHWCLRNYINPCKIFRAVNNEVSFFRTILNLDDL
uniref:Uncharacterized protein n=1 Tax=Anguilla anguilla TaxID=7936 RepID=A0A0E9S5J3_ANGAN